MSDDERLRFILLQLAISKAQSIEQAVEGDVVFFEWIKNGDTAPDGCEPNLPGFH